MAIFASTTTSGYSDPLKAMTIKALEQRQKDLLAQQAAGPGITPENTQTPIQGFGHVANILGDNFKQGRADAALAAQKQALAETMAGVDWEKGPTAPQLARMNMADPELTRQALTTMAENRRAREQNDTSRYQSDNTLKGTQGTNATSLATNAATVGATTRGQDVQQSIAREGTEAAKAAALEKARVEEQARIDAEYRLQARPTDEPLVTLKRALERGEINQGEYDQRSKQLMAPKTAEQKFIVEQQKESADQQSALASLDQALGFIDHPDGIFAGKNADLKTAASGRLPEKVTGLSEKTRENTASFNKIMGAQALKLLTEMKGASSDKDVKINFDIANDPNTTVDEKKRAILILRDKLATHLKIHNAAIEGAGGTAVKLGGSTSADPAVKAATDPARAAGADPAAAEKIVDVISEDQARQLPPTTRFRLPDGRTGRTK